VAVQAYDQAPRLFPCSRLRGGSGRERNFKNYHSFRHVRSSI